MGVIYFEDAAVFSLLASGLTDHISPSGWCPHRPLGQWKFVCRSNCMFTTNVLLFTFCLDTKSDKKIKAP